MPSPTKRLEFAVYLLGAGSAAAYGAACHSAYYAAAHHIAACLGLTLAKGSSNSTTHDPLKKRARAEAQASPARTDWAMLPTLEDLRLRADYRDHDPPTAMDAQVAVNLAVAILAAS